MADMFRLPDIPNAGYATQREKELSDAIMLFMRDVERNRHRLLTIVIEGKDKWRKVARGVFGPSADVDHETIDAIYDYFTLQAVRPGTQALLLKHRQNPAKWREIVRIVMPHLEKERESLRLLQKWGPH